MSDEQKGAVPEENRPEDECRRCHVTMHLANGDDPEDLCHSCAYAEIAALEQSMREKDQTIAELHTFGVVELAVRNPNVASYCEHWEDRTAKAEAENQKLRELVREYRQSSADHPACINYLEPSSTGAIGDHRCPSCRKADDLHRFHDPSLY